MELSFPTNDWISGVFALFLCSRLRCCCKMLKRCTFSVIITQWLSHRALCLGTVQNLLVSRGPDRGEGYVLFLFADESLEVIGLYLSREHSTFLLPYSSSYLPFTLHLNRKQNYSKVNCAKNVSYKVTLTALKNKEFGIWMELLVQQRVSLFYVCHNFGTC